MPDFFHRDWGLVMPPDDLAQPNPSLHTFKALEFSTLSRTCYKACPGNSLCDYLRLPIDAS